VLFFHCCSSIGDVVNRAERVTRPPTPNDGEGGNMLTALLLLASLPAAAPAATPVASNDPPIRVWFNSNGNYGYGDRAKVAALVSTPFLLR
jgi:hypothetical protein